jgi:Tfp pilus assembly protein PilV
VNGRFAGTEPVRKAAGFSLVEVVIALGLLAGVLIAISGLFVLANRQLDGGRKQSIALAAARDILEEMDGWGFRQIYSSFGFDGAASAYAVDTRTSAHTGGWQAELESNLGEAHAEILIEAAVDSGSGLALRDARAIRVRITVHWTEGLRSRQVRLATVRV